MELVNSSLASRKIIYIREYKGTVGKSIGKNEEKLEQSREI